MDKPTTHLKVFYPDSGPQADHQGDHDPRGCALCIWEAGERAGSTALIDREAMAIGVSLILKKYTGRIFPPELTTQVVDDIFKAMEADASAQALYDSGVRQQAAQEGHHDAR